MATVSVLWNGGRARTIRPPRTLITGLGKGMALGEPNDETTHRAVLEQAVGMLRLEAPAEQTLSR